jgi:hypothetical protein
VCEGPLRGIIGEERPSSSRQRQVLDLLTEDGGSLFEH